MLDTISMKNNNRNFVFEINLKLYHLGTVVCIICNRKYVIMPWKIGHPI